jgi:hypothetical protein
LASSGGSHGNWLAIELAIGLAVELAIKLAVELAIRLPIRLAIHNASGIILDDITRVFLAPPFPEILIPEILIR